MTTPLLQTKLYMPPVRGDLVPRPHLAEMLTRGIKQKLTLISAPAGFGKSTLVAHWRASQPDPPPMAWVALDEGDNDPVRFWSYVMAALGALSDGLGAAPLALLRSSPPAPMESVLTVLINELSQLPGDTVLVLDDYHVIQSQAVHDGLTFLLENLPPRMHLIITTRVDPPLPLPRLRARGELSEFRSAHLRFTDAEVQAYFDQVVGVPLAPEQATLLNTRTEGWIAGLKLAGLSLQSEADVTGFLTAFAGSHRHIADYLVEEVLQRQGAETVDFLVQTSIRDRLTGDLCDAVTGRGDSQAILHRLERANLFLIPLDQDRQWYRYHHLFQDLLRLRLQQSGPEQARILHGRASVWFEERGMPDEAFRHALASREMERAAHLVEQCAHSLIQERGETSTLMGWVRALPAELVRSRPHLSLWHAAALLLTGALDEGENWLQYAEQALPHLPDGEATALADGLAADRPAADRLAALRTLAAFQRGDLGRTAELARGALAALPADNLTERGLILHLLAITHRMTGEVRAAVPALTESVALNRAAGSLYAAQYSIGVLAMVYQDRGELRRAEQVLRQGIEMASGSTLADLPNALLADVLREQDDLAGAREHLDRAFGLARKSGRPDPLRLAYTCLARLRAAQGDQEGALAAVDRAIEITRQHRQPYYALLLPGVRAQLHLRFGDLESAARWAEEYEQNLSVPYPYLTELGNLNLARVKIALGETHAALTLLGRLAHQAEEAGRIGSLIEALMLQALAQEAAGKGPGAVAALRRALDLAEPEGYVRLFVDEGAPLARILARVHSEYAARLLAAIGGHPTAAPAPPAIAALVEPLTPRELDVLQLLAAGCSNQEIASRLIVAEGTVKTHTHNIFGKLGVRNRTQAILRARELGLLGIGPEPADE